MYSHKPLVKYELLWTFWESNLTECPEIKAIVLRSIAAHTVGNLPVHVGPPEGQALRIQVFEQSGAGNPRKHQDENWGI